MPLKELALKPATSPRPSMA